MEVQTSATANMFSLMTGGAKASNKNAAHAIGANSGPSPAVAAEGWTLGLINSQHKKYLSAESFGLRVNCSGKSMKKKQLWLLEPFGDGDSVCLKSHLDKYLSFDPIGNVTCGSDVKDDTTKLKISLSEDMSGRWAFRSINRGRFLGGSLDNLECNAKTPGETELWVVHLSIRPQVNIRSVGRKRFAAVSEDKTEVLMDQNVPWGEKTLFSLEWREETHKYAVKANDDVYLSREGTLLKDITDDCMFAVVYSEGYLALRDNKGMYLSPIGSKAVLRSRSKVITTEELLLLEDSIPQVTIQAAVLGKYVSVRQGLDVAANQVEVTVDEKFLLPRDDAENGWYLRTTKDKYLSLGPGSVLQDLWDCGAAGLFQLHWMAEGGVSLKASNGNYISTKKSGQLVANTDEAVEEAKFYLHMVNRPSIVLRCEQGYMGMESASSTSLVCNKLVHELIFVTRAEEGAVHLKAKNGKYWRVHEGAITADSTCPHAFYLELREQTKVCIKKDGKYVTSASNGVVKMAEVESEDATKWEF